VLNFLCCENHRDAAGVLREAVEGVLGAEEAAARCGFVNTVVGRMCQSLTPCPLSWQERGKECRTREARDLPPLTPELDAVILVEDYDPFPIDGGAWRGALPGMPCLEAVPTEQFVAYEHRKLYGHNGVHALLGVLGKARGYKFFYQAGQDAELDALGRRALWEEVGAALARAHPRYFTEESLDAFWDNLYARLVNPVFADEIERGAKDTLRMIRPEDGRLAVAALFVAAQGIEPRAMCAGVAAALRMNGLGIEGLGEVLAEAEAAAAEGVRGRGGELMNDE
jgi:mannitol-1-phosphate/altronate dehydrogenase